MAVMKQDKERILQFESGVIQKDKIIGTQSYLICSMRKITSRLNMLINMPNSKHIILGIDLTFLVTTSSLLLWRSIYAIFLLLQLYFSFFVQHYQTMTQIQLCSRDAKPVVLAKCIMQHIQVSELKKHLSRYLVCVTAHSSIINYVLLLIHLSITVTKDYYMLYVRDTSNLQSLLERKSGQNDTVRN